MRQFTSLMSDTSLVSKKTAIRRSVRATLKGLTPENRTQQGIKLQQQVLSHPVYQASRSVAIYLELPGEAPTALILEDIFAKGKICYVPRMEGEFLKFQRVTAEELASFPPNKWGIREPPVEPPREDPLDVRSLDLILVPGLAFDHNKGRLGKGKGYYDKFIRQCREGMEKPPALLALAFREQIIPEVPMEPHDAYMDEVIFPNE